MNFLPISPIFNKYKPNIEGKTRSIVPPNPEDLNRNETNIDPKLNVPNLNNYLRHNGRQRIPSYQKRIKLPPPTTIQ